MISPEVTCTSGDVATDRSGARRIAEAVRCLALLIEVLDELGIFAGSIPSLLELEDELLDVLSEER